MPSKYNPTKYGAVIRFKEGTTEQEIAEAMNKIKHLLEDVPDRWSKLVQKYDPAWGEPVFYIP